MFGSVLWMLCFQMLPSSLDANMNKIWVSLSAVYSRLSPPCQFSNLVISSCTETARPRGVYPKLKGKSAEVKDLAVPQQEVFAPYKRPGNAEDDMIDKMLRDKCELQRILSETSLEPFFRKR